MNDLERWNREAKRLDATVPVAARVAILGSTDFWHPQSEQTCQHLGRLLANVDGLALLTGGVEGIGEAVGRSFFQTRRDAGQEPLVYHILPVGEPEWDYGETLFAGADMTERREILGRIPCVFVMIEGGPRAGHEAEVASARGEIVIPVGRSGGFAKTLHDRMERPEPVDPDAWAALDDAAASPESVAATVLRSVGACLNKRVKESR